jgi:hypothetical protein
MTLVCADASSARREFVEREQCLAILDEALDRSVVFDAQVSTALNDAVILQFLEQRFDGGLYHHDRWDCKYHPP